MLFALFLLAMVVSIITFAIVGIKLARIKQEEMRLPPKKEEKWFTVGLFTLDGKFSDTKEPYTIKYTLKASNIGGRKIQTVGVPANEESLLIKHSVKTDFYILNLEPWASGTLSLDELKAALPKLQLVPCEQLKNL